MLTHRLKMTNCTSASVHSPSVDQLIIQITHQAAVTRRYVATRNTRNKMYRSCVLTLTYELCIT